MNSSNDVKQFLGTYGARGLFHAKKDGTLIEIWGFGKPYVGPGEEGKRLPLVIWLELKNEEAQKEENDEPVTIVPFFNVSEDDMLNLVEMAEPECAKVIDKLSEVRMDGT